MPIKRRSMVTPRDFEDVITDYGYTVAQVARETGVDRISLSKFRNHGTALKLSEAQALATWMQGNDLWEPEKSVDESSEMPKASIGQGVQKVFPISSISVAIGRELDPDERDAAVAELDKIVRNNDRLMAVAVEYADGFLGDGGMTEAAQRLHEELRTGLVAEAVYRRVLDGSFEARYQEARAETHADELAKENLGALNMPDGADDKAERLDEHQDTSKPVKRTVFG